MAVGVLFNGRTQPTGSAKTGSKQTVIVTDVHFRSVLGEILPLGELHVPPRSVEVTLLYTHGKTTLWRQANPKISEDAKGLTPDQSFDTARNCYTGWALIDLERIAKDAQMSGGSMTSLAVGLSQIGPGTMSRSVRVQPNRMDPAVGLKRNVLTIVFHEMIHMYQWWKIAGVSGDAAALKALRQDYEDAVALTKKEGASSEMFKQRVYANQRSEAEAFAKSEAMTAKMSLKIAAGEFDCLLPMEQLRFYL